MLLAVLFTSFHAFTVLSIFYRKKFRGFSGSWGLIPGKLRRRESCSFLLLLLLLMGLREQI
jgi:hypothetical protein